MQQPNLFSPGGEGGPFVTDVDLTGDGEARNGLPTPIRNGSPAPGRARRSRWITVLLLGEFLLAITVRIFIGVIVMVLPWSGLWDNNHLLQALPHLATLLSYGATRGVLSGIGLLNLWIAVDDTLHRGQRYN